MSVFLRFFARRFPPGKYVFYVALLVPGVLAALAPFRTGAGPGVPAVVCGALAVFTLLFFFRAVDEVKDLDYDRRFHPRRPLVTGEVTVAGIRVYLVGSGVVVLALSAVAGVAPLLIAGLAMAYSLFLFWLETTSPRFERSMYGNIVITIQLKTILIAYVVVLGGPARPLPAVLLVVSFVFAYLHWEIARKTVRPEHALAGEKLYSTATGPAGAIGISLGLLLVACVLQTGAVLAEDRAAGMRLTLFLAPLALTACGAVKFATTRDRWYAPDVLPLLGYMVFLAACSGQWLLAAH